MVLLAGAGAAVALNMPREYVSFPDCYEVFDPVIFENAAQVTGLTVSGEFTEDDGEDHGDLQCEIVSGYGDESFGAFSVSAEALDPEGDQWEEAFGAIEEIREEVPEQLSQGERGPLTIDGETSEDAMWRTSSAGDTGIVIGFAEESAFFSVATATNVFFVDNLAVGIVYGFEPGDLELEEAMDMVHSLGGGVETALRRTGETA
ncbi:hypothetical protein [Nocardiopsis sp. CC223A]|uniref:hypothetical protein n=1 Tax=Nocardiopsis sp. CC223A TaxID=3044051 RepID=UPI00278BC6EA|nr:hypothetical protein [Nocardiopsis sp. CC223A]